MLEHNKQLTMEYNLPGRNHCIELCSGFCNVASELEKVHIFASMLPVNYSQMVFNIKRNSGILQLGYI